MFLRLEQIIDANILNSNEMFVAKTVNSQNQISILDLFVYETEMREKSTNKQ